MTPEIDQTGSGVPALGWLGVFVIWPVSFLCAKTERDSNTWEQISG